VFLVDVNVLVYAFRQDAPDHARYAHWLQELLDSEAAYAVTDMVLSGFVRIVTHPAIFASPSTTERALAFVEQIRSRPQCIGIVPGPRHWSIFAALCRATHATGNLVPDAFLAALAIESGCQWITTDRGFARFPGLRWRHPLSV
jgi:toxin-antitoxin system PIN domain toxin